MSWEYSHRCTSFEFKSRPFKAQVLAILIRYVTSRQVRNSTVKVQPQSDSANDVFFLFKQENGNASVIVACFLPVYEQKGAENVSSNAVFSVVFFLSVFE